MSTEHTDACCVARAGYRNGDGPDPYPEMSKLSDLGRAAVLAGPALVPGGGGGVNDSPSVNAEYERHVDACEAAQFNEAGETVWECNAMNTSLFIPRT